MKASQSNICISVHGCKPGRLSRRMKSLVEDEDYSPDYEYDTIKCNKTPEEMNKILEEGIKKIMKEPMRAKCAHCGEIIEVSKPKEYKSCKCGAIALDFGDEFYSRMSGSPEDFDKEFDEQNGIDRFKPYRDLEKYELSSNTDYYAVRHPVVSTVFGTDILPLDLVAENVWDWFTEKGLSDPVMQMVKVQEEVGELAHEITRGHRDSFEVVDALGDTLVTLIGMCHHLHIPPEAALSLAWSQIKDRKGKVVEGSFVKEEE